jgi:hypothetical protein
MTGPNTPATRSGDDVCRVHVRRYLRAPFLADRARGIYGDRYPASYLEDVVTPGVPPSLGRALQDWVVDEATSDEDVAAFIGWPVARVREHR